MHEASKGLEWKWSLSLDCPGKLMWPRDPIWPRDLMSIVIGEDLYTVPLMDSMSSAYLTFFPKLTPSIGWRKEFLILTVTSLL